MTISDIRKGWIHNAALATLLWSSTDDDGEPLDRDHDVTDIVWSAELQEAVAAFCDECEADLAGMDERQIGHDFILSANRHGAGFWDRGLGERGDRLHRAATMYGSIDLYVGDDGRLHVHL